MGTKRKERENDEEVVFHYGEFTCQHEKCSNQAYFQCGDSPLCGVHSRSKKRKELPKFTPEEKEERGNKIAKKENEEIESAAEINRKEGKQGKVIVTKLRMMKAPEQHVGFLKVFPNFKHENRKDGFGCKSLR